MSSDLFARLIGAVVFVILGVIWGNMLGKFNPEFELIYTLAIGLVGVLFGLVATPYFTTRPIRKIRQLIRKLPAETLFSSILGMIIGLIVGALLAYPLSLMPDPVGMILPFVGVLVCCYFGVALFVMRQTDIGNLINGLSSRRENGSQSSLAQGNRTALLDTSVIIDGRVADIAKTGFLPGIMLIPRFVLNELQYIADSADNLRRARGRRGMEVLAELQKGPVSVKISDVDVEGAREVDEKLVILARQLKCPILTNDYNLNRIAELQGVSILNINELANSVKSIVLPGETLTISILQEGKEANQGVGYLDDGTMVVIENGNKLIGQTKDVSVTKVLQTTAGRMIFAKADE
jgi:uncharacterized protein YacL